jgi:calcineurin-like phosphoesterase family protein
MVHGHCHGNLHHGEDASFYNNRRVIDAGCMLTDYKPISYLEVIEKLKHVVLPVLKDRVE